MNRGHNRDQIFDDDGDCELFVSALRAATRRRSLDVHGFALMKNHFHLLVTPREPDAVSKAIGVTQWQYGRYYNRKHETMGSIWNGRYHPVPIESAWQWLVCLRYIELNPVRAGISDEPGAYRWTSYGFHARGSRTFSWLTSHPVLQGLGPTDEDRQAIFRTICASPLTEAEMTLMRHPPSMRLVMDGQPAAELAAL